MKGNNAAYQDKLDHLRFFAAFLIILYHSLWMYHLVSSTDPVCKGHGGPAVAVPPFLSLILEGHTAVALFMTLSGFLFATICKGKEINPWRFYRNRFLRIYPLFTVVLLVACYMDLQRNNFLRLMTSLFFLQNTQSAVYLLNGTESLWAIAVEFQFYLLFPCLLIFFRKYGYKYLVGLVILAVLIRLCAYLNTGNVYLLSYTTIFGRIDQFVIGMIYGFLYDKIKNRLRHPAVLVTGAAATLMIVEYCHHAGWSGTGSHWIYASDLEAMVWGFLIACYSASTFAFPKKIASLLAFTGSLSYSLYLIHPAVLRLAYWFAPLIYSPHSRFPFLAQISAQMSHQSYITGLVFGLLVVLPVTFVVSIFTYYLIEKPFLSLRSSYTIAPQNKAEESEALTKTIDTAGHLVGARD